jgi:RNA-directed DNA polymerase
LNSGDTKKPNGGVYPRRVNETPALNENLLEKVLSRENMRKAWERVKTNKGAAGVDKMTLEEFPGFARDNWDKIRQAIMVNEYRPQPVRRVEIPKPDGGKRPLGIPTVTDRVIQQAIAQVLVPIFDPTFSDSSFGFRPGRSAHDAVRQVAGYIAEGYKIAVDIDLSKFFDRVNHDILMNRVARKVRDKNLLRLIGSYLRAGVEIEGRIQPTTQGVPQGGPLSPLLANIVLYDLDKELEKRGHRFARYADDFIILVKSQRAADRVMESVTRFLMKQVKLEINDKKSHTGPTDRTSFLGFRFKGKRIIWSEQALEEFKRRIRLMTSRSWGVSMEYRIQQLTTYIRGWINYFGLSEYYSPVPGLDKWLRRRMRMCFWKQWKRPHRRIAELLKLGCPKSKAISVALSRQSYWHLARTYATQLGMTDDWLAKLGLVSIRDLWIAFHYPAQHHAGRQTS